MNGKPRLIWIDPADPPDAFPDPRTALREPDGLLAAGGDLSPARLLHAYRHGIFPWYSEGQPILWWCPDPRAVLFPGHLHVSRSLRKSLRKQYYSVSLDRAFTQVLSACGTAWRSQGSGTWITPEMQLAYTELHHLGHAHSVEVWMEERLVGGLYGVAMGNVFFGESMFSARTDASKIALVWLVKQLQSWNFELIDCQVASSHLATLGSVNIPRSEFLVLLQRYATVNRRIGPWQFDISPVF